MTPPDIAAAGPSSARTESRARRADAALHAIAEAIDHGGEMEAALAFADRTDPLLRAGIRRRIRDAYLDAILKTTVRGDGGCHVMHVAYLLAAGAIVDGMPLDDVAWARATYTSARRDQGTPRRIWWPTLLVAIGLVAIGGGIATAAALGAFRARPGVAVSTSQPPAGVPATLPTTLRTDPFILRAFTEAVPQFLIALDRRSRAKHASSPAVEIAKHDAALEEARAAILTSDVKDALGAGPTKSLEALLAQAKIAADAPAGDHESADVFMKAAGALDDALAAAGLAYFVDGSVLSDTSTDRSMVIMYLFRVEAVSVFEAEEGGVKSAVRALHLRRLDKLNWRQSLLGFTRPSLRVAVVLLDQIDEQLVTYILPGLGDHASVDLFAENADDAIDAVQRRAGELVRAEYGALPDLDAAAVRELGDLLQKRQALMNALQKRASDRGMVLRAPAKLRLDPDYVSGLKGFLAKSEGEELNRIDTFLGDPRFDGIYARMRAALVQSIERHEVQHRLDFGRATALPMPPALEALTGPLENDGTARPRAARARDELSAYLAELARDIATPRVNLTMIARFLFDKSQQGVMESYAAVVIFEGLAAELDLPEKGPFVRARNIDHDAAARAYLAMTGKDPAEVRAAATRLWSKLFGGSLASLTKL